MGIGEASSRISLKWWFYRNARIPLFLSLIAFLSVEILLLLVIGRNQWENQLEVSSHFAELAKLALIQKSSSVLQTGIAARDLQAYKAFVCHKKSDCFLEPRWGFRVLEIPINLTGTGYAEFRLVLQVPWLPKGSLISFTLSLSVLACLLVVFLLGHVRVRLEKDLFAPLFKNLSHQASLPIRELESLRVKIQELNHLRTQEAVSKAVVARSRQVAHDIKSPLTALLFASKDFDLLPGKSRSVIQSAVKRIESIAESLLGGEEKSSSKGVVLMRNCIRDIFEEKKLEYHDRNSLVWSLDVLELDEVIDSPLSGKEIQRLLSNLINNAVEASELTRGFIEVGGRSKKSFFELWVRDEGAGICPEILPLLGTEGATYGKVHGQGLGLSYARSVLEKVGGELILEENSPSGTLVKIICPAEFSALRKDLVHKTLL
jgi:signal transduction histidine kinase